MHLPLAFCTELRLATGPLQKQNMHLLPIR